MLFLFHSPTTMLHTWWVLRHQKCIFYESCFFNSPINYILIYNCLFVIWTPCPLSQFLIFSSHSSVLCICCVLSSHTEASSLFLHQAWLSFSASPLHAVLTWAGVSAPLRFRSESEGLPGAVSVAVCGVFTCFLGMLLRSDIFHCVIHR